MHVPSTLVGPITMAFAAVVTASPQATPAAGINLPIGAFCNRYLDNACANGVECFTLMSDGKDQCGGYMADCDSDSQCISGKCGGSWGYCVRASASTTIRTTGSTASTTTARSTPVSTTPTPTGGLALGASCSPSIRNQCANGANCYATNSMLIPRCGNFQASCTSNAQCAFNTCSNGLCNGFLATRNSTTTTTATTNRDGPATTIISGNSTIVIPTRGPNSTIVIPTRGPNPTTPAQNNEVAKLSGSLAAMLAVAALVALVL